MLFNSRFWKVLLVVAALASFAGATAHEAVHVDHAQGCEVCHLAQKAPAQIAGAASFVFFLILLFRFLENERTAPAGLFVPVRIGRAPPALRS